jgi:dolichol-phosphate mannosyltransferase
LSISPHFLAPTLLLSVVVPTYNEIENIDALLARLHTALAGIAWEIIFVDDDSPDGTAARIRERAQSDARIHLIHRIGRRGLSSALIEGMQSARARNLAVIDADLQHDETLLPAMLRRLQSQTAPALDVVIASRYCEGAVIDNWSAERERLSAVATALSRWVVKAPLTDPMSGYFIITRGAFDAALPKVSGIGYKLLLDLFASAPAPLNYAEIPNRFGARKHGASKVDALTAWDFALLLLDKKFGTYVPARFISFCMVGLVGVGVHFLVLHFSHRVVGASFAPAQGLATLVAMSGNFALNNALTYRDRRLRGGAWWRGWLSFCAACAMGALANVGIAEALFQQKSAWWAAALAGVVVGAVWNYAATSLWTWRRK